MRNVVYVGELWDGGTCLDRADVLEKHGWRVKKFDTTEFLRARSRVIRSLQHRLILGPDVKLLNKYLVNFILDSVPIDILWVDKGRWIYHETLKYIKSTTNAVLVHYTPDPAFIVHDSRHFTKCLPLYDICITNKKYEVDTYYAHGAKKVIFAWQGIGNRFYQNNLVLSINDENRSGIVFIGHAERHYANILTEVGKRFDDLRIWGPGWDRFSWKYRGVRRFIQGGPVWKDDYVKKLSSGLIGLGLLSKYCPDQFTTRSFEIPASGTMLIAERTEDHIDLFNEGEEAEYFSTTEELLGKISFYLNNKDKLAVIAESGRRKTHCFYGWSQVLMEAIRSIDMSVFLK